MPKKTGAIRALAAAVLFGASTPAAKGLLGDIHPQVLAGLLYLGSGAGLGLLWLIRRNTSRDTEAPLTRGDIPWLGGVIPIHWNYHAMLMVFVWLFLVPLFILIIRFGKPRPTPTGLHRKVAIYHSEWWWFSSHKYGLAVAMTLSLLGGIVALVVSKGFSGTVHAVFGILAVTLGVVQVAAGAVRGKHGGKNYYSAKPDDPATWFGDHYNMTKRRRIFEAYHKNAGYIAGWCALAAVASGLMQYPMPWLVPVIVCLLVVVAVVAMVADYIGIRYDGYRAAHGTDPEAPFNKERKDI